MQAALHLYHSQDGDIPHNGHQVHGAEGDGEPDVQRLQSWDASEPERSRHQAGIIRQEHI